MYCAYLQKWLKTLAKDYSKEMLTDTNDALRWLDDMEKESIKSNRHFTPFTFDFDSLYDRLSPDIVVQAVKDAMQYCRPSWTQEFRDWIIKVIKLSMESAFGEFRGKFFKAVGGIATGGSISIELANIAVYFILRNILFDDKKLMKDVVGVKRYIDDGVGIHTMSARRFTAWKKLISSKVSKYGMKIKASDWSEPVEKHHHVNFLDIQFRFDQNGALQTDLYTKPTDTRSFLNFSSCHPNYTFSGIVYSQALRLKRIINCNERLATRLDELKKDFKRCGYPEKMLCNIMRKVMKCDRRLEKLATDVNLAADKDDAIMVISTFGRDKILTDITKSIEKHSDSIKFRYVKKTGPSLKNQLVKSKVSVLGPQYGRTVSCKNGNCKGCEMMSKRDFVTDRNDKKYKTSGGKCNTNNLIYHAECRHCTKGYVGKTTQKLNGRISGHRGSSQNFYTVMQVN